MPGTGPTPSSRSSLEQNIDEQAAQKNLETKQENPYATVNKKRETDERKRSSESSGSTDRGSKSSSNSAEDEERKHKSTKHKKKEHHSRSSSSTDREHKDNLHSTREKRHKSKSHGEKHRSRPSSLAEKEQEPIYAKINDKPPVSSPDEDVLYSPDMLNEGLRRRNTEALPAQPKPPRNGTPLQSSDGASTPSSKGSSPPSYTSNFSGNSSHSRINSPSKFMIRLKYALRQKAFITPITISITFATVYTTLLYFKNKENFLSKITNISDPEIYVPIIIASFFAVLSACALIYKYNKVNVKIPCAQDDEGIFEAMRYLDDDKCIRSITLKYSNNTNVTYLDKKKYKQLGLGNKRLKLTLGNPLISFFGFVSLTTMITYLSFKCLEVGYESLANSLENFSPTNTGLMIVIVAVAITTALFAYSIYHSYRKTHVKGIKDLEQESFVDNIKDKMITYNKEYIKEAESGNDDRETLLTKHSKGKVASLVIDQAIVERYNSCSMATIIPALVG
ncbi:MAG: hypothetical protein sL5_09580 [Candidatus Mesenet longicola]|uniref:Uncharacterized protein n=1 Tax=Candidatus Mesenet longicola TaxID=1892558 RepID=A0A8J3HW21_9RICK|nr:MAG: hypothetical protein sGL2_10170 [Candidatus Mesenet longicola]GHM59965.1 MAG: hypothetical protein sL5_09580 [Candidatus Mesenet longicola]